ncbi:MAG: HAMP domain-containing sensor histidine kinase, partial [Alphaproteobacteria bacterium]
RLVDNLLMFSSGQRLELNRQEHDVDLLVAQVVENFHQRFKEKNIRIELDCAAGKQQVDRGILEQILVNLIGNVEKYAASGGFVNIKAWIEQGRIHIRVKDGGPGIPAHMRADIFKPFFRGRNHLTEGVSGIGIGLPLAVNLAKLHGGELRLVDSQNGACFEVIL